MKIPTYLSAALSALMFLSACGMDQASSSSYNDSENMNENYTFTSSNGGDGDFVALTDPKENAFTIMMPKGWNSQVSMERPEGQIRSCGVSTSPDGKSRIFFGDPNVPQFIVPNSQTAQFLSGNTGSSMLVVQQFMQAEQFATDYAQRCFGRAPGFRVLGVAPDHAYVQKAMEEARKMGLTQMPSLTAANVVFEFNDNGKPIKGKIKAMTFALESIWNAEVNGFTTSGDFAEIEKIHEFVISSYKTNPQWRQQQDARHQQIMQQQAANSQQTMQNMTNAHNQRMQNMQQNFNAHQQRMQGMQSTFDSQNQTWMNNQASQDRNHEQFIDYIRDENTVTNGTQTGKVETGYNYYYVDPNTGNYIGTNVQENPNPSVYQEWKKKN